MRVGKHLFVFLLVGVFASCYSQVSKSIGEMDPNKPIHNPILAERVQKPAILQAISAGDLAKVRALIESGVDVNAVYSDPQDPNVYDAGSHSCTALTEAARLNKLDIVSYLLGKGADVNIFEKFISGKTGRLLRSYSALDYAKQNNNAEMIKVLEEKGAK
jgi:ankyrin repeat protein